MATTPVPTPQQIIDAIDAAIFKALTDGEMVVRYSIGGKSIEIGLDQAQQLRKDYANLVRVNNGGIGKTLIQM